MNTLLNFRKFPAPLLMALGTLFFSSAARADWNWNGQGGTGNMSSQYNWYYSAEPSFNSGGSLQFSYNNDNETSIYDDLGGWQAVDNIYFNSSFTAPGNAITWSSAGNGFDFSNILENDSGVAVTISTPLSGGKNNSAPNIQLNPVYGNLTISGALYNDNSLSFQVWGNNGHTLTLNSGLTGGSSDSLTIEQYSDVVVNAAQTWGGSTAGVNINTGELWITTSGSLDSGVAPVTVGMNDSNTAKMWLSTLTGGVTFNNPIIVNNGSSAGEKNLGGLNTSGVSTYGGTVTLNGQVNLSAASGGTVAFNGVISGVGQNVVVNGYQEPLAGVIEIGAADTYSGSTYISGGTLQINSAGSIADSPNIYLGETSGAQTATLALGAAGGGQSLSTPITVRAGSSGVKSISGLATASTSTLSGAITMDDNLTVNSASGGTLALTGGITSGASGATTLTLGNAGAVTLSGGIGGGSAAIAVTQTGAGTTTIQSANSYTGATTVSAGTVIVTGSLSGTVSASVSAPGTLEVDGSMNGGATTSLSGKLLGTGQVGGISSTGGTVEPGLSTGSTGVGTLTANGNVSLDSNSTLSIRVGVGTETASDSLAIGSGNTMSLGGATLAVNIGAAVASRANPDSSDLYVIIYGGSSGVSGAFSNVNTSGALPIYTTAGGYQFDVLYDSNATGGGAGTGDDVVLKLAAVPEPGTCAGMGVGAVVLALARRRRR